MADYPEDNVAHDEPADLVVKPVTQPTAQPVEPEPEALDEEAYMKKFEEVELQTDICRRMCDTYPSSKQASQIEHLRATTLEQQKLNEQLYELLVEMNNFLAAK